MYTAIISSVNRFEICKVLIEKGININYIYKSYGTTPLHFACYENHLNIIELLLDNGADETINNNNGKTPIELVDNEEIKEFMNNYNLTKFILK